MLRGGRPRNLGWWGGGASADSINRAASRSFYVVEVKTVKMEHLSHWCSKRYRIYEQQPKLSWRSKESMSNNRKKMVEEDDGWRAENQIYNILHMFEPPLLNILQILLKVW